MEFEWDDWKRALVLREHKVDLLYAARILHGPVVTEPDDRQDYGEERFKSIGLVNDECFVVVYTRRENRIRLITAWKGGRRNHEQYQARVSRRN